MTKPMGYFGADCNNPAIASFSRQFEKQTGECSLSDNDQAALVAVLGVWAWGLKSGLFDNFWLEAVEPAIGDGVETSMENETETDPMLLALTALETLDDSAQCYSLIAWLLQ